MKASDLLTQMIKTTDQKIDLMEHVLDKLRVLSVTEQRSFVGTSPYIERLDQMNRQFLRDYQALLRALRTSEIRDEHARELPELKDLQKMVTYVMVLEEQFDQLLKNIA